MQKISKQNKQTVILYVSTLLGTILGVICSIINTRFLAPDQYGNVRYVQNILSFISSLLLFGYFLSGSRLLALSYHELYSRRVRGAMVVILGMACLFLMISSYFCYIIHLKSNLQVAYLFIVSIPVCINPLLSNYIGTTAQGDNHIVRLSISRLCPYLLYIPIAYCIYKLTGCSASRMILLQWGIATMIYTIVIISTRPLLYKIKPIFQLLNEENKTYGFQLYLGSLIMVATNYVAGITIGIINEDNSSVGFYTLALTVTTPLSMIPSIIGTTYYKEFAKKTEIPKRLLKVTILITSCSCILFVLLIKPLVSFLYSPAYSSVGEYASWLAVGFCIHGFGDMLNRFLGSHGKGKEIRNASIANGIVKIFGYVVFVYMWNVKGALVTTVACSAIYFVVIYYYYRKFVKINK